MFVYGFLEAHFTPVKKSKRLIYGVALLLNQRFRPSLIRWYLGARKDVKEKDIPKDTPEYRSMVETNLYIEAHGMSLVASIENCCC